jgi:4-hydroxy-2-oxoheptanedioate aldolase
MSFENPLKQKLDQGQVVVGAVVQIPAPAIIEILGYTGFDFVMIDTEHGMFDIQTAGELIRSADGVGLTPLVRIIKNDESLILKALDLGAKGVIVPHIATKADAEKAVKACKYGTSGRGACPLVRANRYGIGNWPEYQDAANKNTLLIALIEDLAGVENIEEIVSVKGVDAVFLGPFDMSVSAGHKGNTRAPQILDALDKVIAACKKKNIPVMHTTTNDPNVEAWVKKGIRMILQGADSGVFARACADFLKSVAHLKGNFNCNNT